MHTVDPIHEHVLAITDEMTVGEFSHFFDSLFDGKAMVRIIHNKRRQFDEVPLKGFINPPIPNPQSPIPNPQSPI